MISKKIVEVFNPAYDIPSVLWSADTPLTFLPRINTTFILFFGLWLFGTGDALLLASDLGVSPWLVFAQGLAHQFEWSVGFSTFIVSLIVLLLWIPLKEVPGFGTISNVVIIAVSIDVMTSLLIYPESTVVKYCFLICGVILIGIGTGLYLTANLGPGPRDGLMTGLQRRFQFPISWVRCILEVFVLCFGWLLGGTVGVGSLIFALGIGYCVAVSLAFVNRFFPKPKTS